MIRIGVNGDEHVGLLLARSHDAITQLHEVIAVASEHSAHPWLAIDPLLQLASDRQRHGLLTRTTLTDRTRILAAMTRIDGDDDIAAIERTRLVLKGGGTVTLPQRSQVEVVTGPYERMQRDEGLTRMLQSILLRLPRQPPDFILPLG